MICAPVEMDISVFTLFHPHAFRWKSLSLSHISFPVFFPVTTLHWQ